MAWRGGRSRSSKAIQALLKLWIVVCAGYVVAGWLLSALGELNAVAYGVITALAVAVMIGFATRAEVRWYIPLFRFRRPLPLAFALLACAVFLGAALHPPSNYEGVTYRLPRILHWISAGQWIWVPGVSERMNFSAPNFEWLIAPLFVLTRSDRLLFLLNFIPFLFLPGLLFSTYRMLKVPGRVAWAWMWILPAAYCYALQAGSIGDDALGAVLILAAVNLGLRGARTRALSDAYWALIALALATGIESTNLPLVLPCLVALWPIRRLGMPRPLTTLGVLAVALVVSLLPTAALNYHFTGDWAGYGPKTSALRVHNPLAREVATVLRLGAQTLQPPVLPGARAVDERATDMLPTGVKNLLNPDYPQFQLQLGELPQEEVSGLGLAVILLLIVSLAARLLLSARGQEKTARGESGMETWITVASVVALLLYHSPIGCEPTARMLAPYFCLLLPPLLTHPVNLRLVRSPGWRFAGLLSVASAVLVVVLTPARPLWPAQTVLAHLRQRSPQNQQLQRAQAVYSVYSKRNDLLSPLRESLPVNAKKIAVIEDDDDSDYALWRPFGSRTVRHIDRIQELAAAQPLGVSWLIGKTASLRALGQFSPEQFEAAYGGQIVATTKIASKVRDGPEEWFVMRLTNQRH